MLAIGLTDHDWFTQLRDGPFYPEVNFWTPTPWRVTSLQEGDHFYFLLKSPIRKVGGEGSFSEYCEMPVSAAWERWGPANGVTDQDALQARMRRYAARRPDGGRHDLDPIIGCIVLQSPQFYDDADFFAPESRGAPVPPQVVKYKTFPNLTSLITVRREPDLSRPFTLVEWSGASSTKSLTTVRPRQQQFRHMVLSAYEGMCAITGEACAEVLEAAHIQPYVDERSNDVRNGLLLRADIHALFDAGLISFTDDYRVCVSQVLTSAPYLALDNLPLRLPSDPMKRPSRDAITFHRRAVFRGG